MMLASWNLGGISTTLGANAQATTAIEATPELASEPTLQCRTPEITPKRRRFLEPAPKQPSAREYAERLLGWIRANVDIADGPITHAAMLEFYTEMLIELGWTPRPWNSVGHQFRLITTDNRKTYAWIRTTTGTLHRLRVYPIPRTGVGATDNGQDSVQLRSAASAHNPTLKKLCPDGFPKRPNINS